MAWSVDWWMVVGWSGSVVGVVVAAWALFWDRARGRKRCPKCWYDMGSEEGGHLTQCPECGRVVQRERELRRTRRRWRWATAGLLFALMFTAHDPAGVRTRGWVALVPTTVLVALTPVEGVMKPPETTMIGMPPYGRTLWLEAPSALHKELYWRIDHGEFRTWHTQLFFDRVARAEPDFSKYMIRSRDVWMSGADVKAYGAGVYLDGHCELDEARTRLVGAHPGEWEDWVLRAKGLEDGRYRLERELVWNRIRGQHRLPREEWKVVWRGSREIMVGGETTPSMRGLDTHALGAEVDGWRPFDLAVVEGGEAYLFTYFHGSWPLLEHAGGSLAVGFELEAWRDGELVIRGRVYPPNPTVGYLSNPAYFYQAHRLERVAPLHRGDRLMVRLTATERAASLDVERDVYWDGVIEFEVESLDRADRVVEHWRGLLQEREWSPAVAPMEGDE